MSLLLDQFKSEAGFRPSTCEDLFALRLAQKLDDAVAVRHYVELAQKNPEGRLLHAFRASSQADTKEPQWKRFHRQLERAHDSRGPEDDDLIAIRVERRAVAAAVFRGQHLEYADARQLSSTPEKALNSAVGFVRWMLSRFTVDSAALEAMVKGQEIQRSVIHDAICKVLREQTLPIWEMARTTLLDGCGYPALKSRDQLRQVASQIWPILAGTHAKVFMQDAAILGLHVQIERLFIINGNLS